MNKRISWLNIALLTAIATGCASVPKNHALAPEAHTIEGGREVQISVAQGEIKTNINQSNVAAAAGGGLLMALIDAGVEAHRAKVAEEAVKPLRDALVGYDFDARAQASTKATLEEIGWFAPRDYGFVKEINADARSARLDATKSDEMAFVDYEYGMSADFDAVEVNFRVSIANRQTPPKTKPVTRLYAANLVYHQWHKVVIPLNGAAKDKDANVIRWSANGAALTKQALAASLTQAQSMIKRGLTQSAETSLAIPKGARTTAGGYTGSLIEKVGTTTLLWIPIQDQWVLIADPIG